MTASSSSSSSSFFFGPVVVQSREGEEELPCDPSEQGLSRRPNQRAETFDQVRQGPVRHPLGKELDVEKALLKLVLPTLFCG